MNKALEEERKGGVIGSALAAEVTIKCFKEDTKAMLDRLGDELRFVLITSAARSGINFRILQGGRRPCREGFCAEERRS